jgi:predicted enzyme related to lactoylglutathione lyase
LAAISAANRAARGSRGDGSARVTSSALATRSNEQRRQPALGRPSAIEGAQATRVDDQLAQERRHRHHPHALEAAPRRWRRDEERSHRDRRAHRHGVRGPGRDHHRAIRRDQVAHAAGLDLERAARGVGHRVPARLAPALDAIVEKRHRIGPDHHRAIREPLADSRHSLADYRRSATAASGYRVAMSQLAHFAINSDDVDRSRAFYQKVFGWTFTAWGPPGFYQLEGAGIRGALQARRDLVPGQPILGFECTIAVASLDAVERAVLAEGGTIVSPRTVIAGVGTLLFFREPGGAIVGAMQYDPRSA